MVAFFVSDVEPWGSATAVLDLMEIGGRWMELAQDGVQWRALVLAVLDLGVLLRYLLYGMPHDKFVRRLI